MKTLLISYGDFDYDGRLRELYKVVSSLGTVIGITRGHETRDSGHHLINCSYLAFIIRVVAKCRSLGQIDVLFLDNRKAIIPGLLLKRMLRPKCVVVDSRELYVRKETPRIVGKIGCIVESRGICAADIVVNANKQRAEYVRALYNLRNVPLVYENLRKLEYSSPIAKDSFRDEYEHLLRAGEVRIISSAGCDVSRLTDLLVEALPNICAPCRLYLVGASKMEDEERIRDIARARGISNLEIIGRLNQDHLKYLVSNSHIGIVSYHQRDTNNRLCASGKLYEFVYEGLPVVTTSNPPLSELCLNEGIGVSGDSFCEGINLVINNYDYYRSNVTRFAKSHTVEENNRKFAKELKNAIDSTMRLK